MKAFRLSATGLSWSNLFIHCQAACPFFRTWKLSNFYLYFQGNIKLWLTLLHVFVTSNDRSGFLVLIKAKDMGLPSWSIRTIPLQGSTKIRSIFCYDQTSSILFIFIEEILVMLWFLNFHGSTVTAFHKFCLVCFEVSVTMAGLLSVVLPCDNISSTHEWDTANILNQRFMYQ